MKLAILEMELDKDLGKNLLSAYLMHRILLRICFVFLFQNTVHMEENSMPG